MAGNSGNVEGKQENLALGALSNTPVSGSAVSGSSPSLRPDSPKSLTKFPFDPLFSYGNDESADLDPHERFFKAVEDGASFVQCIRLVDGMYSDGAIIRSEVWPALLKVLTHSLTSKSEKRENKARGFPKVNAPLRAAKISWILDRMALASWRPDDSFLESSIWLAVEVGDTRTAYLTATMLRVRQRGEAMSHMTKILRATALNGDSTTAVQILEDFEDRGFFINTVQLKDALEACLGSDCFARKHTAREEFVPRISAIPGACRLLEILAHAHQRLLLRHERTTTADSDSTDPLPSGFDPSSGLARLPDILYTALSIFKALAHRHHYQAPVTAGLRRVVRNVIYADLDRFEEAVAKEGAVHGQRARATLHFKNALVTAVQTAVAVHDMPTAMETWSRMAKQLGGTHKFQARAVYKTTLRFALRQRDAEAIRAATALLTPAGLESDVPLLCSGVHFACQTGDRETAAELMSRAKEHFGKLSPEHQQQHIRWRKPKEGGKEGEEGEEREVEAEESLVNIVSFAEASLLKLQNPTPGP